MSNGAGERPSLRPVLPRVWPARARARRAIPSAGWFLGPVFTVLVTALAMWAGPRFQLADVLILYLLGVVVIATNFSVAASVFSAVISVLAFDFVFCAPPFTFSIPDLKSAITCAGMLVVAVVISRLTGRLRDAEVKARGREARTSVLYALSRALSEATNPAELAAVAASHVERLTGIPASALIVDERGELAPVGSGSLALDERQLEIVRGTWSGGTHLRQRAVWRTRGRELVLLPLVGAQDPVGLLVLDGDEREALGSDGEHELVEVCVRQAALAIERFALSERATATLLAMETERARSALLSSLSHDFRTPLATIVGAGKSLVEYGSELDATERRDLAHGIVDEGERLNRLLNNVLAMTRLESGSLDVKKSPCAIEEIVDSALRRFGARLESRKIDVRVPCDAPLVSVDPSLIEQVVINLVENALRHTPEGSAIDIAVRSEGTEVALCVADHGPGVPAEDEVRIFEKFYRSHTADQRDGGMGLGLAICKAAARAHGGRMEARNRPGGGLEVTLVLPASPEPPRETTEAEKHAATRGGAS